jgi:hypothetical protein
VETEFVIVRFPSSLLFIRLHGELAPAYETGATRKFKLGRTDTIRSASMPTLEFVQAMANPSCSVRYRHRYSISSAISKKVVLYYLLIYTIIIYLGVVQHTFLYIINT